jgi:hypothetical protein
MRSFKATAVIFVIGVLASKVIAGNVDSPLHNRYYGEVVNGYDWKAPNAGVNIQLEIYSNYPMRNEEFIRFEFTGKTEAMAAIGVPAGKVTCEVMKSGKSSRKFLPGRNVVYKLKGESKFCSVIQFGASQGEPNNITLVFDGKDKMLSSKVRRNNSRGFIVGMMQSMKYNDWTMAWGAL